MITSKITSVSSGKCLNIYGDNIVALNERRNVCLWSDSGSREQRWAIMSAGSGVNIVSIINIGFGLNVYRSGTPWNCDVYPVVGNETDALIHIIQVGDNYKFQLANYPSYYLTAGGNTDGSNVYWAPLTNDNTQLWSITDCDPVDTTELRCPLDTYVSITQGYSSNHLGIDYGAYQNTPIKAAKDGTVIHMQTWTSSDGTSDWASMGNAIYVQHDDGMTLYMHMNNNPSDYVYLGKHVNKGDVIGLVGTTGNSSGNHLHFGYKLGTSFPYNNVSAYNYGTWVNPLDYME